MHGMLTGFKECSAQQTTSHTPFCGTKETSIQLHATLKRKKTALNAHPELLEWHLKETNHLSLHETLKDTKEHVHRNTPLKCLMTRCNLEAMAPKLKHLTLPFLKGKVDIPHRDAKHCIVFPRVKDKHFLFNDENPVAPPPEKVAFQLEDMNTSEAMLESHKPFVKQLNQAILGIKLCIDGAKTVQF